MQNIAKQRRAEKMKEDLRKLVNTEGNKHCAVCATRGPIYAVVDFQIFVCSTCSAIHRSMQHKVKGLSMSEFTDEELAALRVGGNVRAATIWKAGYHLSPPPAGDDYRVRECIRACFEERRFFDRAAFTALQEDIATAILPPVKVLMSLDAMPIPQPSAPTRTAGAQPTTPALTTGAPEASRVVVPKPPAPSAPRDGCSTLDSTDLFASHQTSVPVSRPAVAAPAPPQDAFDDFFASRTATVPQQQRVTDDPFGPMTSSTAAPQRTAPAANSLDFFLAPTQAPAHHNPQSTGASTSAMDYFSGSQPSSMAPKDFFTASTVPQQPTSNDFFAVPSAARADIFAATVWEKRPADANLNNVGALPQTPAPPPQALPSAANAFADLDPFGARPRN
jgi:hypothetical protein